jgi:hypothetical protein
MEEVDIVGEVLDVGRCRDLSVVVRRVLRFFVDILNKVMIA